MKKKIVCVLTCFLMIFIAVLPVVRGLNDLDDGVNVEISQKRCIQTQNPTHSLGWDINNVDTDFLHGSSSLALDSYDNPHISYYSSDNVKYAYSDGGPWSIEIVDPGAGPSLALDSNNHLHLCYTGPLNQESKYAYSDGGPWHKEAIESGTWGILVSCFSIDLDSMVNPHVCYVSYNAASSYRLRYTYKEGATWIQPVIVDAPVFQGVSLALDSSDHPHIIYFDFDGNLKYAYGVGSPPIWTYTTVDDSGDMTSVASLALDSFDNPHIAYVNTDTLDLKYAHPTGSPPTPTWQIETVGLGVYPSLALDSTDHPHISYTDSPVMPNQKIKYAYNFGGPWNIETVDSGAFPSLALDSLDNPHISYISYIEDHNLKYAKKSDCDLSISIPCGPDGFYSGSSVKIKVIVQLNGDCEGNGASRIEFDEMCQVGLGTIDVPSPEIEFLTFMGGTSSVTLWSGAISGSGIAFAMLKIKATAIGPGSTVDASKTVYVLALFGTIYAYVKC